ncbi:retrovirus-related Pol polyprotein from transposon TNT 1-94 [Trichonephila inaurata madagascariensis]|uniref:Retrovirus-related Pol polyprotein from transposon TNT 1-94 n=1 Tax=Trichonephila inaurata madagascariensis TaxID=2747483 RepID=A0A8X6MKB2_9ARAC|nr:retrovirus-related Pol polyprotein from transposon TNT 1-94 [Trichonephila inaurata madagascariensis]
MSTLPSEYFEFKSVWESEPIDERSVNKLTEKLRLIEMRLHPNGSSCQGFWKKESKPKVDGDAFVCTVEDVPESEVWIANSGVSVHMTKHKNYFVDFTQFNSPKPVYVGDSDAIMAYGHGTAHIRDILSKYQIKSNVKDSKICDGCCCGKQCRRPFGTRKQRATTPGKLINIDVCGPMQQQSLGGAKFYVCFKDDFPKYRRVIFMQPKNEVSKCLETFLNEAKNAGHMVKEVLSDGEGEVINSTVKSILEKFGISSCKSMPYTPQQNGAAKRENRTIVECARSIIYATNLPLKLWAEAEVISIHHLRVFGTECFVHVPQQKRRKWDKKSVKGVFVGYSGEKDGYRIWIRDQNKVTLSRDAIFQNEKSSCVPVVSSTDIQDSDMEIVKKPLQTSDPDVEKEIEEILCSAEDREETLAEHSSRNLRDRSMLKMPAKFDNFVLLAEHIEPETYKEAMASEDRDSDYAGDPLTRRSTSGMVFKYNGGAIAWRIQRQNCIALSTTEAEFIVASQAAKEAI